MDPNNRYTKMQQNQYDNEAADWTIQNKDPVVGSFDAHNNWADYDDFLFKNIDTFDKIALDFGCGPARNIVKFNSKFQRIDGVDISSINLTNAIKWCETNNVVVPRLFNNNGVDLSEIESEYYDIVFSTICLQHICVHEIRFNFLKEFHRILKPNGVLCIQMGFGPGHTKTVGYFDNNYDAQHTNSGHDTRIDSPNELEKDLVQLRYHSFEYNIRPTGPGDIHGNWIFFRAFK